MNDCMNPEVRDALPDLLHGRLSDIDTATMTAHVESCAECRAELALLRDVRASGAIVPLIDAARVAAAIPPYAPAGMLEAPGRSDSLLKRIGGWRLAAAVALVAIAGLATSDSARRSFGGGQTVVSQIAEAPSTASTGSTPMAQSGVKAAPAQVASLSLVSSVQDLSDSELEQLLADLDDIETIPSAEPTPVALPLDETEGGQ